MVRSFSVPEVISDPIVDNRDQELSGMNNQDPIPASARKTKTTRFRLHRSLRNKNGNIRSVGVQAICEPREAVRTITQNASTDAAPALHTYIFLLCCTTQV